ncbi:hypothetical protein C9374_006047 [Naegleria lovaniensis]|uniref:2-nitropropane dioxygenase n=1 Tax=Naegleria lovaniensis TaxID=51637 RepID=A0AA88KJC0_NAELO|nr:uncharacterized protein C9374_006047 [Naegleria lovaniensis]KAG2381663.1 hypothetical protein C9374_006047 [Naegleria lovaniensis]
MAPKTTLISKLFGIQYPLIQAPMAGIQKSAMTIAVSESGALGSLPCAMLSSEEIRNEISTIIKSCSKPYNVNFFCHQNPTPEYEKEEKWRRRLESKYYNEFQIAVQHEEKSMVTNGPNRTPFNEQIADILEEFKPPIVSFHFGLPSPELLRRVKHWNSKIISSATTLEEALWLESQGVDAIIAQGSEAGGHRGMFKTTDISSQMGLFALLPQIVKHVHVPVIAAGGIVDATTVAAAMKLGASGVQVGTTFMLCHEATTSQVHRQALEDYKNNPSSVYTVIQNVLTGKPARCIMNRVIREMGPISEEVPQFPRASQYLTTLRARAESIGLSDFSPIWSGQNASGCKSVSSAEIVKDLVKGFEGIL